MWIKSVLQFASNHSQNYVFRIRATDQYRFRKVFQASFADWYLFIQDRIFNDRDGWSSPHINTGLQLVTLC